MFFYGFVGVTLAWQLLFFAIAYQPVDNKAAPESNYKSNQHQLHKIF